MGLVAVVVVAVREKPWVHTAGKFTAKRRETQNNEGNYKPTILYKFIEIPLSCHTFNKSWGLVFENVFLAILFLSSDLSKAEGIHCDFQGFVRRKTILKEGRKISLSSWQRYWLQISGNRLLFYASKSFKGWVIFWKRSYVLPCPHTYYISIRACPKLKVSLIGTYTS